MILAIVRIIDTKALTGVYAAADINDLRALVDETCTPSACEYAAVSAGGFSARDTLRGEVFEPTALLANAMSDPDDLCWQPLDPNQQAPGSQIDALLATAAGRSLLAQKFDTSSRITLPVMAA